MKLIRFGAINEEKPGVLLTNGTKIDVSAFGQDYDEAFFGSNAIHKLQSWLENNQDSCPIVGDDVRLGPPLSRPSKIVCVGLNYAKHAAESGMDIPEEPVLFFKASSAIVEGYLTGLIVANKLGYKHPDFENKQMDFQNQLM